MKQQTALITKSNLQLLKIIKRTQTMLFIMVGLSLIFLLTGCQPQGNPLEKVTPQTAAQFLVSASQAAEQKLNVFSASGGGYYGRCIQDKLKPKFCDKLYHAMVDYAHTSKQYPTLTVNNIKDNNFFISIETNYQRDVFNDV